MRNILCILALCIGCGSAESPVEPPSNPTANPLLGNLPTGAETVRCPVGFGPTWAMETYSAVRLPPNGGTTDYASVVTVIAHTTSASMTTIRYQRDVASCATASPPQAVVMTDSGLEEDGVGYTGVIPSFPAGTHVCWRISASPDGIATTCPPSGTAAFSYTTK